MNCPKCQFDNPEEARFCNRCGQALEISCGQCGKTNPRGSSFCNQCGHDLRQLKEVVRVDPSRPASYTPKHLADQILTSRSALEGERKIVTVLFADVASFTALSQKLDPEEVHQIMDGCFQILMTEIHRYEGTINQFTGDGVMALFGAPLAHEDHAQRACHAALAIQKALAVYGERIQREYGVPFQLRIGLNSGPVVVGKIGDDLRMDYTAIGDTTNLASRLQSLASPGAIWVSAHTHRLAHAFFEAQPLGKLEVKGKEEPQEVYQLLQPSEVETRIQASVARGLTRFVGRKNSMAVLMEVWEKARCGSGQVVSIVGEAGVGKSRLLLEFRSSLLEDALCLEGRCIQYAGSILYLPILDLLRSYLEIKEGDREVLVKRKLSEKIASLDPSLQNILPPLQELLSLKVEDQAFLQLEPRLKRERTFEALRDLFIRESQHRPLILAIEDLHWIDKTSEEFLGYLIDWLASVKVLLILLYRPEYTHPWGSKSYYSHIALTQLTRDSSAELIQAILQEGEVVPELRQLILDRAAGNPLFMEEFTHSLLENGSIQKRDDEYILSKVPSEIEVPDTIQGVIAARMDRLEENLKRTLQVASVIGRDFAFRILHLLMGMKEELKSHLLKLQGLEFIYEKSLFPELEYLFKHALTQEVAYNSLLLKRRREIHEKIGAAIEQLYAERLEEFYEMLAYHYSKSEDYEKAIRYLRLSGEKAARSYATWEAFRFYHDALDLLKKSSDGEKDKRQQVEVLYAMTGPSRILGYPEDSLQLLQEGERLSKEMEDSRSLAIFSSDLGAYHTVKGNPGLGVKYTGRCFKEAERLGDVELMVRAGFDLCYSHNALGRHLLVCELAQKLIALLEKTGKEKEYFGRAFNPYAGLHGWYGYSAGTLGDFKKGEDLLERGLRHASEIDARFSLSFGELMYGMLFYLKGDGEKAIQHSQAAIRYAEEGKHTLVLGNSWSALGGGYLLRGDLGSARRAAEKGLQIIREGGFGQQLPGALRLMSRVHFKMDDLQEAQVLGEEALRLEEGGGEEKEKGRSKVWLGRVLAKRDPSQAPRAIAMMLEGISILDEFKLKPLCAQAHFHLGQVHTDTGQKKEALEYLRKARGMFEEMGMEYWLTQAQAALHRLSPSKTKKPRASGESKR